MRKKLFFFFLMLLLLLPGCNQTDPDVTPDGGTLPSDTPSESPAGGAVSLRLVTSNTGRNLLLSGAGTDGGYYDSLMWTDEMYAEDSPWIHISNLLYTDYATQTRVYLCGVPGCAHNSENCTSYIRYPRGIMLFTDDAESVLFCMATGAMDGEVYSDDDLGFIYRMELDGSAREEILRLQANESFSLSDPVIAGGTHLYLCVDVTTDAAEPTKELRRIDLETTEVTKLIDLKYNDIILSAYDDMIVIQNTDSPEDAMYNSLEERIAAGFSVTYRGYSVSTGEFTTLYEGRDEYGMLLSGHYKFSPSKTGEDTGSLNILDFKTGETKTIENIPQDAVGILSTHDYFDGKLHWGYVDKTEIGFAHDYIIDLETGDFWEKALSYDRYFADSDTPIPQPVPIIADLQDSFLVLAGERASTITMTDREGIPHVYDFPNAPVYAIMPKEDYWNNNPNYTFIDDTVTDAVS